MSRIFLIGNGPSLNKTPLGLLKNEDTMAMNAIDLIYENTDWRPTFYFCMDVHPHDKHRWQAIESNLNCKKLFLWDQWKDRYKGENIEWISRCKHHTPYPVSHPKALQNWHLPSICNAHGSMSPMMQLAVKMGYTEIYLVGVDLFTSKHDHFSEDYPAINYLWEERNKIELHIHEVARRSSPVPIYNATIGGNLEVHPRVNIERILSNA